MSQELVKEVVYSVSSGEKESVEILDADWKDEFGLALLVRKNKKSFLELNGVKMNSFFSGCQLSRIRWINRHTVLLYTYKNKENKNNIFIVDSTKGLIHSFHGGDGIEDMVVGKEGIWISYFAKVFLGAEFPPKDLCFLK